MASYDEAYKLAEQQFKNQLELMKQQQQGEQAWSADQARKQQEFQERMSNTAHQREIEDLKAAGLNPVLSAGGQGASTPTGAMADSSSLMAAIPSLIDALNTNAKTLYQAQINDEEQLKKEAEAAAAVAAAKSSSGSGRGRSGKIKDITGTLTVGQLQSLESTIDTISAQNGITGYDLIDQLAADAANIGYSNGKWRFQLGDLVKVSKDLGEIIAYVVKKVGPEVVRTAGSAKDMYKKKTEASYRKQQNYWLREAAKGQKKINSAKVAIKRKAKREYDFRVNNDYGFIY